MERGGHAHRTCHQVLIASAGRVRVELDETAGTREVTLSSPTQGLFVPALIWAKQTYIDDGSELVVLASHPYDVNDYIDDREVARKLRLAST